MKNETSECDIKICKKKIEETRSYPIIKVSKGIKDEGRSHYCRNYTSWTGHDFQNVRKHL